MLVIIEAPTVHLKLPGKNLFHVPFFSRLPVSNPNGAADTQILFSEPVCQFFLNRPWQSIRNKSSRRAAVSNGPQRPAKHKDPKFCFYAPRQAELIPEVIVCKILVFVFSRGPQYEALPWIATEASAAVSAAGPAARRRLHPD